MLHPKPKLFGKLAQLGLHVHQQNRFVRIELRFYPCPQKMAWLFRAKTLLQTQRKLQRKATNVFGGNITLLAGNALHLWMIFRWVRPCSQQLLLPGARPEVEASSTEADIQNNHDD